MNRLAHCRTIWLIGASSGIGEALINKLDNGQRDIFISARRADKLQALSAGRSAHVHPIAMDITDSEQIRQAINTIGHQTTQLDMVLVNAGSCEYVDADQLDVGLFRRVMETNFLAVVDVIQQVLSLLQGKKGKPHTQLVLTGSSVTYLGLPRAAAYGGSKAALRYLAESLHGQLQDMNIDVRMISPGFVDTPLTAQNDFAMPCLISADEAADYIVKGLQGSAFDIHFPRRFTVVLKLLRCLPDRLRLALIHRYIVPTLPPSTQE